MIRRYGFAVNNANISTCSITYDWLDKGVINQERGALHSRIKRNRIFLLILFSLGIVGSAFIVMYIAWTLTRPFGLINSIALILAGIIDFALGSLAFWRFSVKLSA